MDRVCIYLRKSRADLEAEARGEGETLTKHKKILLQLAQQQGLHIRKICQEIVSGESLIHRAEMMQLLAEIEDKQYDAVLVMDMDRLGRGNMREQGLILETFQKSGTKIITPRKTYDLQDEFDEEYSEFEAFMARKELKVITRRLQSGRMRSIEEGNYLGTRPPYGYQIQADEKGRYLVSHPDQAAVVGMIFAWYTMDHPTDSMGANKIANRLNELGYHSYHGMAWNSSSILHILKNAVYIGRIQWKKRIYHKANDPLKRRETKTRPQSEWIDVKGKHHPLIASETFAKAQSILKRKAHTPYHFQSGIVNPLAGLIKCEPCGAAMVLRPYSKQQPHLICYHRHCTNKSTRFAYVEQQVIQSLQNWMKEYKLSWEKGDDAATTNHEINLYQITLKNLQRERRNLEIQKERLHDLLERGIYDEETYIERSHHIENRIDETKHGIDQALKYLEKEQMRLKAQMEIIPKVESVIQLYQETTDPKLKNTLLKSVLSHCEYKKEKGQVGDNFLLRLFPIV
jgi:site-specific DNA recombinase